MISREKSIVFNSYRFQLNPTSKNIQIAFAPHQISTVEELIDKKNIILKQFLDSSKLLESCKKDYECQLESKYKEVYIFRIGFKRHLLRTKRDFTDEKVEDWPNAFVIINNNPKIQKVLVQRNFRLGPDTTTILKKINDSLNDLLREFQLHISIEPLFESQEFWKLVEENWNQITMCDFELITPNMANISRSLSKEMRSLLKSTNTVKSHVKLESDPLACLELSKDNPHLSSLVDYSAEGGGNVKLKIRGYKKYHSTAKNVKQITIDKLDLEASNIDMLQKLLPDLFK